MQALLSLLYIFLLTFAIYPLIFFHL